MVETTTHRSVPETSHLTMDIHGNPSAKNWEQRKVPRVPHNWSRAVILGRTLLLLFLCENILNRNPFSLQAGGQRMGAEGPIVLLYTYWREKHSIAYFLFSCPRKKIIRETIVEIQLIFLVYSATDLFFSYYSREMREGKGGRVRPLRQVHVEWAFGSNREHRWCSRYFTLKYGQMGVKIWER